MSTFTAEPRSIPVIAYRDEEGHPTCCGHWQTARCRFLMVRKLGTVEVCGVTGEDIERRPVGSQQGECRLQIRLAVAAAGGWVSCVAQRRRSAAIGPLHCRVRRLWRERVMTRNELALLMELRARIEAEDYIGTCGDRKEAAKLECEHYELLARIDSVLRHHGRVLTPNAEGEHHAQR